MKEIPLSQGCVALVDDEDFIHLNLFKWYAKKSMTKWYAVRKQKINRHSMRGRKVKRKDTRKTIRMHNVIMKPNDDQITHHINEDSLNNQKYNLENCTFAENVQYAADIKKQRQEDNNPFGETAF